MNLTFLKLQKYNLRTVVKIERSAVTKIAIN